MTFFELTDPVRSGDIIRAEGRKHYAYSFGPCRWVRTTVMMSYMNPDSPLYGKYREVSEAEARDLVLRKSAKLAKLLPKAEELARKYHAGQYDRAGAPYFEHPKAVAAQLEDLEQKITAWLHDLCEDTEVTPELLLEEGFTPRIVQAVQVLTRPEGMDYYDYIRTIRPNAIARAVKIADLTHNMDLSRLGQVTQADEARVEKYRKALAYLNMEGELPAAAPVQETAPFTGSMQVFQAVSRGALQGQKRPHGVSNPVLRSEGGTVYLAFFVYFYDKKNLDSMQMPRPSLWLLADVRTGAILERYTCTQRDFSHRSDRRCYSVCYPDKPQVSEGFWTGVYAKLDRVRQDYLESGTLNRAAYEAYLEEMLTMVPPEYRVFYRELSTLQGDGPVK